MTNATTDFNLPFMPIVAADLPDDVTAYHARAAIRREFYNLSNLQFIDDHSARMRMYEVLMCHHDEVKAMRDKGYISGVWYYHPAPGQITVCFQSRTVAQFPENDWHCADASLR